MTNKRLMVILGAFLGLIIASASISFGFEYLVGHNQWLGLIVGAFFMISGVVIYQFGKKWNYAYVISFVFNMIGVGLSITAYYVLKAYALEFRDFGVAISIALALLIGFSVISRMPFVKKHNKLWLTLVIVIAFVSSLVLWIMVDEFTGLSFYFLNVIYFFMLSVIEKADDKKDVFKELAINSMGAFILVSIIVLIVLSEGEALNGLDFDVSGFGGGKKKKIK